ncbi:MAG: hypothetical protein M3O78_00755, partial [Chloroflexota bacterium]|nr:hypothetical protein [Chloroflexota bacterium]
LYLVTTQIANFRAVSPFADDPWDAVVSYAAIGLPLVVGATWVRSLRHRGTHLQAATAQRIRTGVAIALLIIGVNVASDLVALLVVPSTPPGSGLALIVTMVAVAGSVTFVATALLLRAMRVARPAPPDASEPDLLDDLLGLAGEVPGLARLVVPVDRFLASSAASPRRHRLIFGLLAALAAGLAFDIWHAIVEGPWASPFALTLFATLVGAGVLVIYLVTLVPLRLIRPAH